MATPFEGNARGPHLRRFRFDDDDGNGNGNGNGNGGEVAAPGRSASGRRFVIAAALTLLAIWGGLYLAFRGWRADYRERADYGVKNVAEKVNPLAAKVPPGLDPATWGRAVSDTRDLLVALTGANVLGGDRMREMGIDLSARVTGARPESALAELVRIWHEADVETGPVAARVPRPDFIKAATLIDPLEAWTPADVARSEWLAALAETRVLIAHRAATGRLGPDGLKVIADRVASSGADRALPDLARTWDEVDALDTPPRPRPGLFGTPDAG